MKSNKKTFLISLRYIYLTFVIAFGFITIVSTGGGEDGGEGGATSPTQTSEPTPPLPQTSVTDDSGQVTFLTSQGQIVTFEVKDGETLQTLPNVSITFAETQNNVGITVSEAPSAEYVQSIYTHLIASSSLFQTSKFTATAFAMNGELPIKIGITLLKTALLEGSAIYSDLKGISYITMDKNYTGLGIHKQYEIVTVDHYINYVMGKENLRNTQNNLLIGIVTDAVEWAFKLSSGIGLGIAVTSDVLLNPISNTDTALCQSLYFAGIIDSPDPNQAPNEEICLEFIEPTPGSVAGSTIAFPEIIIPRPKTLCSSESTPPSPPANLKAMAVSPSQIKLTWDDDSNELGYNLEYSLNGSKFESIPACVGQNVTTFSHQFLSPNTTYYYRIYALNSAGSSDYSNMAQAKTLGVANQNPVISSLTANLLTVSANGTSTLTCIASDPDGDALTYNWTKTGGSISGNGSTIIWIAPSTTGNYTVTCNISDGEGGIVSKGVSIIVTEPTTPLSITTTSLVSGTVEVSYGTNLSATGGKTPYTWSIISGNMPTGLSLNAGGIISGTPITEGNFNFTVKVTDSSSPQQTDSKVLSIVVNPVSVSPPTAPNNLSATALSQNNIALVWQDNSDNEIGFKIERKTGTTGTFSQIATIGSVSGSGSGVYYEDTSLNAGTTYCYRVQAYNSAGNSSYLNENCTTTNTATPTCPTATTDTATNILARSVTLNGIVNPNGVSTGAFFQWGTSISYGNTTSSQVIGSGTSNLNITADLTGLSPNTTYYFRIVSTNTETCTVYGDPQSFKTGKEVTVANTSGTGRNLRSGPSTSYSVIALLPEGTTMSVVGGPVQADGYTWWNITGSYGTGWSTIGEWLTPEPQIGITVTVTYTGGVGLHLRSCADLSCSIITTLPEGTQMNVFSGPTDADGYTWWALQGYVGGTLYTGWSAVGNWLIPNPRY